MITEIWRRIPEAPYFAISNHGRVQNLLSGEYMEEYIDPEEGEFLGVYLMGEEGNYFYPLDALVVEAFMGPVDGLEMIEHIDGDPWNNAVWNLNVNEAYWDWWTDCE